MKRSPTLLRSLVAIGTALVTLSLATPSYAGSQRELAAVRAATAKFHDVQAALDAGYVRASPCVPGMGYHYVNFAYSSRADVNEPTVLLYIPSGNRLRLVAVEWVVFDADQDMEADESYSLFGQQFHGPMSHGIPIHRELHVWLWQGNPAGTFAQTNPNVVCP